MINRRLIRIKVFQALFSEFGQETLNTNSITKRVQRSMQGLHSNLLGVLSFGPQLSHFIKAEQDPKELKYKPTSEDLKSFKLFTQNSLIEALEKNQDVKSYIERPKLDWNVEKDTMFIIYKELKKSDNYKVAMVSQLDERSMTLFGQYIYKHLIFESVEFEQVMEDQVIYWYDEKIPILKSLEKIFEVFDKTGVISIPELSKNEFEDYEFAQELINHYVENKPLLEDYINEYTPGWDSDRITKIDYVLMTMALCEFKYLPMIPVKVTLNEYIEIAKMYSTPKSSKFLNGTLDKILKDWKERNLINKKGRGLIG